MDNKFAVIFGIALVTAVIVDLSVFNGAYLILWGRELLRLEDWIAFWR